MRAFNLWGVTASIRQPGKDARRIGMRVHDRAACRRQHYTTSLSRQARKPVVRPPWNGYIHSNEKGVFLCILSFVAQQKKVRVKKYDANGNMTAVYDTAKQFNRILYWDDDNRLTKTVDTTSGSSLTTTYAYDAKGMRIIKDGPYGKSIYIDTGYVESGATQTATAPIVSNHIFVGNTRVASVVKHTEEKQPATYFYASDHLGSSSVLTTQQGSYHERIEYLPYGETWVEDKASSSGYSTPYKFTGKELDTETGLYYFGARYYDARISRWISADKYFEEYLPTKPKENLNNIPGNGGVYRSINIDVYHYGGDNPLVIIDPDGNEDIIFVNNSNATYKKFESVALVYEDNTLDPVQLKLFKAWGAIKKAFGSSLNEKDAKMFFGNPDKEYDNFTTLPNKPDNQGTAEEGILYNYKERDFKGLDAFVLWDEKLGTADDRKVPQAKAYNKGVNPATKNDYVQGSHMHTACGLKNGVKNPDNEGYDSGSRGCIVRYGGFSEFNNYLSDSQRNTGRVIIFR
ncbi:MAG TPA: RHS repeat-associated core domain-containing protein [Spirochaetota bacterium]|nr:RHS repeat-associated core domain-containing protein [Spirochaetota bacterium]HPD06072.1 RHS repeat-associated core domain-containing protein [Spirochaetota bacterium]HRR61766.1 RHS repeat-associated core domain-containing protein [Spirochaetota bacterium]